MRIKMLPRFFLCICLLLTTTTLAEDHNDRAKLIDLHKKWGNDFSYSGIATYAHLPHVRCLVEPNVRFDIGIIGVPFDTAVSYRTGARFGPRAIRVASARQTALRGLNYRAGVNPYASWARLLDCGDIPVNAFDNDLALAQMDEAFVELLGRDTAASLPLPSSAKDSHQPEDYRRSRPVLLALGGDHSVALPHLRALKRAYGESLTVVHFDAHLDTWDPRSYGGGAMEWPWGPVKQSEFTHGSMFWMAAGEGLVSNYSTHLGLRTRLTGTDYGDYDADTSQGWRRFDVDAIDEFNGPVGLAEEVVRYIGTERPVYLSIDIDVLDPGLAPGTGTPEPGGWTTRELIRLLRGIEGLNVVGADVVEVAPSYDGAGEQTALAAAQVCYEILTSLVGRRRESARARAADTEGERTKDEL